MADYQPTEAEKSLWSNLFSPVCKPAFAKRLSEILHEKQATVFSTTYCPYCNKAKALLQKNEVGYNEIMLDELN